MKIRSETVAATVYQKHRTVQSREDDVYGLTLARCWKVKARGYPAREKLRTEAPVNGGGNYDNGCSYKIQLYAGTSG